MIVTLTPNPSIDYTVTLTGRLERGAVLRADSVTTVAGGKGVNISRAAVAAEVPTVAVLPAVDDDPFVLELLRDGVDCRPEQPAGPIRSNVTVTEPDGTTTKVNTPGATVAAADLALLFDAVVRRAERATWVVLAGSLPPGAPDQWYADLVDALRPTPAKVAVDTSGAALSALAGRLVEGAVALLKPNAEELATMTGADESRIGMDPLEAARAADVLVRRGAAAVLATLGGSGAVLATPEGAWHATPPPTTVVSTVGAGDSSLFGYLFAELNGAAQPDRLRHAVAYGSAAAGLPGTTIPAPAGTRPELVAVRELTRRVPETSVEVRNR